MRSAPLSTSCSNSERTPPTRYASSSRSSLISQSNVDVDAALELVEPDLDLLLQHLVAHAAVDDVLHLGVRRELRRGAIGDLEDQQAIAGDERLADLALVEAEERVVDGLTERGRRAVAEIAADSLRSVD